MIIEIILFILLLGILLYRWISKSFDKWEKMGIPYVKPSFPFGSYNFINQTKHLTDYVEESYEKYKNERFYGWFLLGKPVLNINDLDVLKNMEVKDFSHFSDRNEKNFSAAFSSGGKLDKLWGLQMANASGEVWKDVRSTFTPIFTSGKMKGMLKFIAAVCEGLTSEFDKKVKTEEEFELKDVFGKFSLDALASCAFGVNAESFTNEKSVFVTYAARIFLNTHLDNIGNILKLFPGVPKLFEILEINIFKPKPTKFFRDVIYQALKTRKTTKERKNDMIDLMLDAMKHESLDENENEHETEDQYEKDMKLNHDKKHVDLDDDVVVATAMIFLVAGYDTTGMTLSFLAYALSNNPEIQTKLQDEIDEAFEQSDGKLPDYNTIQSLPYLDMVIHETLRLYAPVGLNTRSCTQDYTLPGTDVTIKKNDLLSFCVIGIHKDPRYWSHPNEFYPEHFSTEEKSARHGYAFQAFGQGPRACVGMRFALLEAKVAVLSVFRRFSFLPGTKTKEGLKLDPKNQLSWVEGGLWARAVHRKM